MAARLCTLDRSALLAFVLALFALTARAGDASLVLLIQPLPHEEMPARSMQPLANYIAALTKRSCVIDMPPNFPAYWEAVRRHRYDLAFDTPYFTDYRIQKFGFTALVKTPETASYSLIMRGDTRTRDPGWLVGRQVASLGLLSVGTLRLNALYPNPMRQPVLRDVKSTAEGLRLLRAKKVEAAFLPTSLVETQIGQAGLRVVLTTEPVPLLVLSASPRLAPELVEKIRDGLLRARETERGRAMLRATGLDYLAGAANDDFANQRYALKDYWGY